MAPSAFSFGFLSYWISLCYSLSLKVNGHNGSDSLKCLQPDNQIPCRSLEFVGNHYDGLKSGNTVVTITSSELILKNLFHLSNVSQFTLQGRGIHVTSIICQAGGTGAGIYFSDSSDIVLQHFTIEHCTTGNLAYGIRCSLMIFECLDVTMVNVSITLSYGYGLVLLNTKGNAMIESCRFENNSFSICNGGWDGGSGGLYIQVNNSDHHLTDYVIKQCEFINNSANIGITRWESFANHGGGISVDFLQGSAYNNMTITNCSFVGNKATLGGGTNFRFESSCRNNSITVQNCAMESNMALFGGGGGDIVFNQNEGESDFPLGNSVHFVNCIIATNTATFGGGVALHIGSPNNFAKVYNLIIFKSCKFIRNMANGGAAVDINRSQQSSSSGNGKFLIAVSYFRDCLYSKNKILDNNSKRITQNGVFFTSNVHTHFEGDTCFENNTGTALYISKIHVHFINSTATFRNNIGFKGGAILLIGEASLRLLGDNQFTFENNSASYGGAICAERLPVHHTHTCFIEKRNEYHESDSFTFINNKASTGIANDIFVSKLLSCEYYYSCHNIFQNNCMGYFTFSDPTSNDTYATAVSNLTIEDSCIYAFPGIPVTLNISQTDQFGTEIGKIFTLFANTEKGSQLSVDNNYRIIKLNQVMFTGRQRAKGTLVVRTDSIAVLKAFVAVEMLPCPAGFRFNETTLKCMCSVNEFISHCEVDRAVLRKGYWVGYLSPDDQSYVGFGNCDYRICNYNQSQYHQGNIDLPAKSNPYLEAIVCASKRTGILCGVCKKGYTVYYHSPSFICHEETPLCLYGPLMYILSETIPVTALFLVVIFFNIHLTSGPLYSFMFYAQSLDILGVDAFGTVQYEGSIKLLFQFYKIFYGFFNMDILNSDSLSFCLLRKMNILDTYLVQYFTIIYSLLLIVFTLLILKINSRFSCSKLCCQTRRNTRSSVINGLTAFVVICYFKCIDISYHSNVPIHLFVNGKMNRTVVLFNGEYEYLKGHHLKYAIFALVVFVFLIAPLPLLLILESVLMRVNRLSIVQRKCASDMLFRLRLKVLPFLDSFQGCFKDDCRFFAGLYFVYRILLISSYLYANHIEQIYIATEVTFLVILSIHVVIQPFQNSWHNKLDIFLLVNIALVNFITLNQYYRITLLHRNKQVLELFALIQVFFMTLPFLYFITYSCYKVNTKYGMIKKIWKRFEGKGLPSLHGNVAPELN